MYYKHQSHTYNFFKYNVQYNLFLLLEILVLSLILIFLFLIISHTCRNPASLIFVICDVSVRCPPTSPKIQLRRIPHRRIPLRRIPLRRLLIIVADGFIDGLSSRKRRRPRRRRFSFRAAAEFSISARRQRGRRRSIGACRFIPIILKFIVNMLLLYYYISVIFVLFWKVLLSNQY